MKITSLFILLFLSVYVVGQTTAPLNPDFIKYQQKKADGTWETKTASGYALGEIPEMVSPHFQEANHVELSGAKSFPSSYDLRSLNLVSPVKNQNPWGTCWAHAGAGSIESYWMKQGGGVSDLSESNLATCHGFEWGWNDGGNRNLVAAYMARMSGPIFEADDSYSRLASNDTLCHSGLTPAAFEAESRFLPNDMNTIKQAIMDHGAIYTNYYHDDDYYNNSNKTYYCYDDLGTNHAVLVVGWDDNKDTDAPQNGAWIIKNSWGTGWGESGYFYISYYDHTIHTAPAYFPNKINYDANNQLHNYNELGYTSSTGYGSETAYGLIKFVPTSNQYLTKVGTYVNTQGTVLDFEIFSTFNGGVLSGSLGTLTVQTCTFPGNYMFDLTTPIYLSTGTPFYIKVKYNTPGYTYPIPFEVLSSGYAEPSIESGVCWVSGSGNSWSAWGSDISGKERDLTIKAYGDYDEPIPLYSLTVNVKDGYNNPIVDARVNVNSTIVYTNSLGNAVFNGLSSTTYLYSVEKSGFNTYSNYVSINGDDTYLDVVLTNASYTVTFNVSDGINPISGANVNFNSTNTLTNAQGIASFANVGVGNNLPYIITKSGYLSYNNTVNVTNQNIIENVTLELLPPTTKLVTSQCGAVYSEINTKLVCDIINGANQYEWKFVNSERTYSQILSNPLTPEQRYIYLSQIPLMLHGYTYDVSVRAKVGSTWGDWGDICEVTLDLGTTKLVDSQCGITVTSNATKLVADLVSNANQYEFEFVNAERIYSQILSNPIYPEQRYIYLSQVPGMTHGYTYDVKVRAKVGNTWGDWGEICEVTLNLGTTKLVDSQCGIFVTSNATKLIADLVPNATQYEWEFTNSQLPLNTILSNPTNPEQRYIYLSQISGLVHGYTYNIRVRAKVEGIWSNWGTSCQVTLGIGTTKIIDSQCGLITNTKSTKLVSNIVPNANQYQWEFINTSISYTQIQSNPSSPSQRYIYLSQITGLQYGYTYSVRVRAKVGSTWGVWGDECEITLNNSKLLANEKNGIFENEFDINIYPNPVSSILNIEILSNDEGKYIMEIKDITGRLILIEEGYIDSTTYQRLKDVSSFESGIYFINVYNGDKVKSLKFIKK